MTHHQDIAKFAIGQCRLGASATEAQYLTYEGKSHDWLSQS